MSVSLSGCFPVLFFGAASTATSSVGEERGLGGTFADSSIKTQINMRWLSKVPKLAGVLELTVREGRVLLSGTVDTPEEKIEAIRLAWDVAGVREVIDRIEVGDGKGLWGYVKDSWITGKMRALVLADREVHSINYTVTTARNILYVMGIALSSQELERVLTLGREISGVEKVVSYVRIKEKITSENSTENTSFVPPPSSLSESEKVQSSPESVKVESLGS